MPGKSVPVTTAISSAFGQMRCDRDMAVLLETFESLRPVRFTPRTGVEVARRGPGIDEAVRLLRDRQNASSSGDAATITTQDLIIDAGTVSLPARAYAPRRADAGPRPVIVYFHGGGWVLGSIDSHDASARDLARHSGAIVVSVGYRKAPEHPFPAAWDDALAAHAWMCEHAASLQGDATRIALAGEGSGGTLALATAIAARDRDMPMPLHVLAVCPVTQAATNTQSYLHNAVSRPLGRAMMTWCFEQLARQPEDLQDSRLALTHADLKGLPPVTLVSAQLDPLHTDAQRLHESLRRAGVPVAWQDHAGVTHGFFGAASVLEKARQAQQFAGQRLAQALAEPDAAHPAGLLGQARAWLAQMAGGMGPASRGEPARASA